MSHAHVNMLLHQTNPLGGGRVLSMSPVALSKSIHAALCVHSWMDDTMAGVGQSCCVLYWHTPWNPMRGELERLVNSVDACMVVWVLYNRAVFSPQGAFLSIYRAIRLNSLFLLLFYTIKRPSVTWEWGHYVGYNCRYRPHYFALSILDVRVIFCTNNHHISGTISDLKGIFGN